MLEENRISVSVLDAPVGTGKTTAIFKWMRDNPSKRYLYVSPMLSEVEDRVPRELESLEFVYPTMDYEEDKGTASKSFSLLKHLKRRNNIAFSHVLFTEMTPEHLEEIRDGEYTLIIDEEVAFIGAYSGKYTRKDTITLISNGWIKIHEDQAGRVEWVHDNIEEGSQYYHFKEMSDLGQLFCAKGDKMMLVTQLPMELLSASKENILLTYMFESSIMYSFLTMRGVSFTRLQDRYPEISLLQTENDWKEKIKPLITISSTPSTTKVKSDGGLSLSWYMEKDNLKSIKAVGDALNGICRKHGQENVIFTMPKQSASRWDLMRIKERNKLCALHRNTKTGEGYFLYSAARATNNYIDKTVAVHAYNRYPNVAVKGYLQDYGGVIGDNEFALSELVQWLWRTGIRAGKPITVYFLSERMERIFINWLYPE